MMFSSLKNRLRSRTRVTIVMFHDVWCFEESAPFSYTCHNCGVPERVVFWRIGSVLAHVSQLWCSRTCGVLKNRLRSRTRVATLQFMVHWIFQNINKTKGISMNLVCSIGVTSIWNRAKSGSGDPGPEIASRGTKSITFAKGLVHTFDLPKFLPNPIG